MNERCVRVKDMIAVEKNNKIQKISKIEKLKRVYTITFNRIKQSGTQ
jgi:hypothetical protein